MNGINRITIPFAAQKKGRDQDWIDKYVLKLSIEYARLQQKYNDLYGKYFGRGKRNDASMAAVPKGIADADVRGIRIVAEANSVAPQITGIAHLELARLQQKKDRVVDEIFEMIKIRRV